MICEDLKAAIMKLDKAEQRQLVLAVLPEIWPNLAGDDACLKLIKQLLDQCLNEGLSRTRTRSTQKARARARASLHCTTDAHKKTGHKTRFIEAS